MSVEREGGGGGSCVYVCTHCIPCIQMVYVHKGVKQNILKERTNQIAEIELHHMTRMNQSAAS